MHAFGEGAVFAIDGFVRRSGGLRVLLVLCTILAVGWPVMAAESLRVGGTGAALGTLKLLAAAFSAGRPGADIRVLPYVGSTGAIKAVAEGAMTFGVSGRPASADEAKLPVRLLPYAKTPLVMAAHPDVGSTGLTRQQLIDIYAGRATRWPDGAPIRLIVRTPRETDNDVLRNLSPDMAALLAEAYERPGMRRAATDQDTVDQLERVPGALGPTTLAVVMSERRNVRVLAIDGVLPSLAGLRDGIYRPAKTLFLVLPAAPTPATLAFVDFIFSPRGQEILSANGLVPLPRENAR